jgi:hypothetical protein
MLDIARGKGVVNRIVGQLIQRGEVKANRVEWTDDTGDVFTNPSTPVVTLYDGEREVTAVCITQRRLERMNEPQARRKVAEMIRTCFQISSGERPAPRHRV